MLTTFFVYLFRAHLYQKFLSGGYCHTEMHNVLFLFLDTFFCYFMEELESLIIFGFVCLNTVCQVEHNLQSAVSFSSEWLVIPAHIYELAFHNAVRLHDVIFSLSCPVCLHNSFCLSLQACSRMSLFCQMKNYHNSAAWFPGLNPLAPMDNYNCHAV
jgi:hypothetical protein